MPETDCNIPPKPKIAILLFLICFFTYGYFFHAGGDNQNVRFGQARAMAELGKHHLDTWTIISTDTIKVGEHIYSNKPPGAAYALLLPWRFFSTILGYTNFEEQQRLVLTCYLSAWFSLGVASALLAVILYWLLTDITRSHVSALILTLGYSLATSALPYSIMMFSHQLTALCLLSAFALLTKGDIWGGKHSSNRWLPFIAGLVAGYSIVCDYLGAIGAGLLGCYLLGTRRSIAVNAKFIIGGALGILPLLFFNLQVFGTPFATTVGVENPENNRFASILADGFYGASFPTWEAFLNITIRPIRGLFYGSPWLYSVLPATVLALWRRERIAEIALCLSISIAYLGFVSALSYWHGGGSIGPRYCLPMVPFMVLLIGLGIRERLWFPMLISPLVVFSAAQLLIVTALLPNGGGVPNPYSRAFELYRAGIPFRDPCFAFGCAPNGGWLSFTWGELIGLPSHLQLAPVFVFWAISFVLLFLCAVKLDRLEITRLRAGSGICLMVLSLLAAAFIPAFYH